MMLTPETIVEAAPDQLSAGVGAETVILELSEGVYFSLADVGAEIWKTIASPSSVQSICDRIVAEYDVEPEECRADVVAFLQELIDNKLARVTVA